MKQIFLETHNIEKMSTGFGQFNYHLLKGLKAINSEDFKFTVHLRPLNLLKSDFGNFFKYKRYFGARRYHITSVRKKYALWHSVNQNTKIEPHSNKIPYVLTVHDVNFIQEISDDLNHERNQRFIEKLNRADSITYISEYAKKSTHQYFEVPKVPEYVIYNGNPILELENLENYNLPIPQKYIYAIGDFLERKNFHLLVEMMQHLPEDFHLIISGNATRNYAETVRDTIQKLNLNARVVLTGRVSEKDKQYYFKNCTAFALPSLREGFGLPAIEAMRFGMPIFLANTTSLPEIGGEYAFYFNDFNPENMATVIKEGLKTYTENKDTYIKKLVERAAIFSWEDAAKQYIDVYKKTIALKH